MAYFDDDDRSKWGKSNTSREDLDKLWLNLTKRANRYMYIEEELHFLTHCTSDSGKKGILESDNLRGGSTKFPTEAPLESYLGLRGTWFSLSSRKLPKLSPYGTQRCIIKVKDMLEYLGKHRDKTDEVVKEGYDRLDTPPNDTPIKDGTCGKGGNEAKGGKSKIQQSFNKWQREYHLKEKVDPPKEQSAYLMPLLFFECAHCFGSYQYIRLLLIREIDPNVDWCKAFCKQLNIEDNPFFKVRNGRLSTHRRKADGDLSGNENVFIELLVVGDIQLDQLPAPPVWDKVGLCSEVDFRAGSTVRVEQAKLAWVEDDDRSDWGNSKTSLKRLDELWDTLLQRADNYIKQEIYCFVHCTTKTGKKGILDSRVIRGWSTNLPANAPLGSNLGLTGTWFELVTRKLPRRSPYGTQRFEIKVKDMIAYLGKQDDGGGEVTVEDNDKRDAPSDDTPTKCGKEGKSTKGGKGDNQRKVSMPMLFFECAHCYGNKQYVRLLLVRAFDPKLAWCQRFCKELNIQDNPFFQIMHGRLYSYRRKEGADLGGTGSVFIEVLVVGDIQLDQLPAPLVWDEVGTVPRARFDPRIGLC